MKNQRDAIYIIRPPKVLEFAIKETAMVVLQVINAYIHQLKYGPKGFNEEVVRKTDHYDQLKKSIVARGIINPIIITPNKVVEMGNTRLLICKDLGHQFVPIIVRPEGYDIFKLKKQFYNASA